MVAAWGCQSRKAVEPGSVVFLHPDGAGLAAWEAYRYLVVGPDGDTHYDQLEHVALYRGHMRDSLTASSNGGATSHAFGVKVGTASFGNDDGRKIRNAKSWLIEARDAGIPIGMINSGTITEPGTACFVADTTRDNHSEISSQLLASRATVILGGGERYFLPQSVQGRHGKGIRKDGRNLVEEARKAGYVVVFTRDELLALPGGTKKVLGLFASDHTFNEQPEEVLEREGKPLYWPVAPTLAEMTEVGLRVLRANRADGRFALVVEEEGTDNFGNNNNARGMFEALRRSDETVALLSRFVKSHPRTLVYTTCDSDAGGMRAVGAPPRDIPRTLPAREGNGSPVDGINGTETAPFTAAADKAGVRHQFRVVWATKDDTSGGIAVKGVGYRSAELVKEHLDNTDIAEIARAVLFGRTMEK